MRFGERRKLLLNVDFRFIVIITTLFPMKNDIKSGEYIESFIVSTTELFYNERFAVGVPGVHALHLFQQLGIPVVLV